MIDEYARLYSQGMSGDLPIHELALRMSKFDVNLIPSKVGEQLNRDMTQRQIDDIEGNTRHDK